MTQYKTLITSLALGLSLAPLSQAEFLINEFLAENTGTSFNDEDGFPADWIEIHNPGPAASINGYHLTDDATNLTKWTFPNVTIPANGYLLVFASGKDRTVAGQPLHANFSLDIDGEFLALVKPDGTSTVTLFSPEYPKQYPDISYGNGTGGPALTTTVHAVGDPLTYHVPSVDIGTTWRDIGFDDSSWTAAHSAVGWGYNPPVGDAIAADGNLTDPMKGTSSSIYLRLPFQIDDPNGVSGLVLKTKVDDGFVAYLNGFEVASKNKPSPLAFNSKSDGREEVEADDQFESFTLNFAGRLEVGENILALHGLNDSVGSSDFILIPELVADIQSATPLPGPAYLSSPTPNNANGIPSFAPPGKVDFDVTSRAFTDNFDLTLSVTEDDAVIYYTTDGSLPTNSNNNPSPVYDGPITIDSTTLVRARAYLPGSLPGEGRTEGYFLLEASEADFSSNLPIILLSTYGGGSPPATGSTTRKESFMLIYEPDPETGRASFSDTPSISTRSGIRKRGSSSASFPKYAMSLESWDEFNEDQDIKPLGLSPEADWILNARYTFDYSLIRNPFLYELSNQIGQWAVKTRFVELYNDVNGGTIGSSDYFGVYTLMEKIEPDNNRLDISKLDPWENSPEEITGGYVFKNDRPDPGEPTFSVSGFQRAMVHGDPDGIEITAAQKSYITTHTNQVTTALRQADGIHPVTGLHFSDYLDVDSFVDHFWLNLLAMDPDWGRLSQFFHKDRGGKIVAGPIWDYDRTMGSRDGRDDNPLRWEANTSDTSYTWFDREYEWFGLLFGFNTSHDQRRNMPDPQLITSRPDVFQKVIDRWYELRSNQFSESNLNAIIDSMAAELSEAQARNFSRWTGLNVNSISGQNFATGGTGWNRQISHLKGWLKARSEWIDTRFFRPPTFSQNGGVVASGFQLTMTASQGGVYFTTDGSDPRASGGTPAAGSTNGSMVTLNETTTVTARAYDGAQWGAPTTATFVIGADLADPSNLVISEMMYQPSEPTQDEINAGFTNNNQFEYLELLNISGSTLDLTNVSFTDGIDFDFAGSAITVLAPGGRVLVVRDQAAFEHRYGFALSGLIAGEFANDSGLSGSGEQIILMGFGGDIRNFTYNDKYPWPETPDGDGPSLVLIAPIGNPNHDDAINWRASVDPAGSAGGSDAVVFGPGDKNADNDGDGLNAFAEHAFGTSDLVFGGQILTSSVDSNGRFTVSFPKNLAADDALIIVEVSTDMVTWTPAGESLEHDDEIHNGDGTTTLTLRTPEITSGEDKLFVRLGVFER